MRVLGMELMGGAGEIGRNWMTILSVVLKVSQTKGRMGA